MGYNQRVFKTRKGIQFRTSQPCVLKSGHLKCRIYLLSPNKKTAFDEKTIRIKKDKHRFAEAEAKAMDELIDAHYEEIIDWIKSGQLPLVLNDYYELFKDDIFAFNKWSRKAEMIDQVWHEKLYNMVHAHSLDELGNQRAVEDALEPLTHHRKGKKGYEAAHIEYFMILNGIFQYLVENGFMPENPIKDLYRSLSIKDSTIALENLARTSLSEKEITALVHECLPQCKTSSIHAAILVQLFTGLTVNEICGLNLDAWFYAKVSQTDKVSWLAITQKYQEKKGDSLVLTNNLENLNQYRRVVCIHFVEKLLALNVRNRKAQNAGKHDPLFVSESGQRLIPSEMRREINSILERVIQCTPKNYVSRYSRFGKNDSRMVARNETLRSTFTFLAHEKAKLSNSKCAALLGIDRVETYAIHYTDWRDLLLMLEMRQQLDRICASVFDFDDMEKDPCLTAVECYSAEITLEPGAEFNIGLACSGKITLAERP